MATTLQQQEKSITELTSKNSDLEKALQKAKEDISAL